MELVDVRDVAARERVAEDGVGVEAAVDVLGADGGERRVEVRRSRAPAPRRAPAASLGGEADASSYELRIIQARIPLLAQKTRT